MALPTVITNQNEINEYLHARIAYIEEVLSGVHRNFPADMENLQGIEIDASTLPAVAKTRLKQEVTKIRTKIQKKA